MGHSYNTKCNSCGDEKEYLLDVGATTPTTLEMLIDQTETIISKELYKHLLEKRNGKLDSSSRYRIFECPKCETLHTKFNIKINYKTNKTYVRNHHCESCNSYLVPLDRDFDISQYRCSSCTEKMLEKASKQTTWE